MNSLLPLSENVSLYHYDRHLLKRVPGEVSDYSPVGTGATAVEATDNDGGNDVFDHSSRVTDGTISPVILQDSRSQC